MKKKIILSAINQLGPFFKDNDEEILSEITDDMISIAFSYSNRNAENSEALFPIIKKAVIATYKLRGSEGFKSLSQSGKSMTFNDIEEKMRQDILKSGLRLLK